MPEVSLAAVDNKSYDVKAAFTDGHIAEFRPNLAEWALNRSSEEIMLGAGRSQKRVGL